MIESYAHLIKRFKFRLFYNLLEVLAILACLIGGWHLSFFHNFRVKVAPKRNKDNGEELEDALFHFFDQQTRRAEKFLLPVAEKLN